MKLQNIITVLTAALIGTSSAQTQVGQVTLTPVNPTPHTAPSGVKPRPVTPKTTVQTTSPATTGATTAKTKTSFETQQVPAGWYNLTGQVTGNVALPQGTQVVLSLVELQNPSKSLLQIKFGASRLPVPYQMYFNPAKLQAGKTYALRAKAFSDKGILLSYSDSIALPKTSPSNLNIAVKPQ